MILRLFKSTGFKGLLVNLFVILLFWSVTFFSGPPEKADYNAGPMPLYNIMVSHLQSREMTLFAAFSVFLLLSYLIVHLNTSLFFLQERTYLPSLMYVIFCTVFVGRHSMNPALPAALFMLLALRRMMDAYRKNGTAFCFFDAGLLTGTGILFYANLVWFALLLVAGVVILRGYNIKEMILSVTGMLVPSILITGFLYVFNSDPGIIADSFVNNISLRYKVIDFPVIRLILIFTCLAILFYALVVLLPRINNMKIKSGKVFSLLIWMLLISVIMIFHSPGSVRDIIYLGGLPAGYMLTSHILNSKNKILNQILVITLFLLAVASLIACFFQAG